MRSRRADVAVNRVVALMNGDAGAFSQMLAADIEGAFRASFAPHETEAEISFLDGEGLRE